MLSNLVLGHHKFVLFVDEVGAERSSRKVLENLLDEQKAKHDSVRDEYLQKISVILEPISKLELEKNETEIVETIQKLKYNKNVTQIFGWATTKNIRSRLLIPFLEHMSDLVVTIKSEKLLTVLTKRKFGSIKLKSYQHELLTGKTSIREHNEERQAIIHSDPPIDPETIGTFKIGQFKANEMEAKKNLKLPFEIM